MSEKVVFEVKDYSKECEPFEFKLPGDKHVYKLKPFSLLDADGVDGMVKAEREGDLHSMINVMTEDEKVRALLGKLPLLALRDLAEAWKEAAGITSGE